MSAKRKSGDAPPGAVGQRSIARRVLLPLPPAPHALLTLRLLLVSSLPLPRAASSPSPPAASRLPLPLALAPAGPATRRRRPRHVRLPHKPRLPATLLCSSPRPRAALACARHHLSGTCMPVSPPATRHHDLTPVPRASNHHTQCPCPCSRLCSPPKPTAPPPAACPPHQAAPCHAPRPRRRRSPVSATQ